MGQSAWSHRTFLPADPQSAGLARDFVCTHLLAHDLDHLADDVRLVVSELATNAVAHAQTPFVVTLSARDGTVLLDIEDGSPSDVLATTPDVMDMSGRGLMIVEVLSQDWGTSSHGHGLKSVWATFPGSARE